MVMDEVKGTIKLKKLVEHFQLKVLLSGADYEQAETYFRLALGVLRHSDAPGNDMAVTYCNLAEMYDKQNPEDPRIGECVEEAWQLLNDPQLPRDGYHAFTVSKCAPSFDYLGYFLYAKELKERAAKIYAGA